MQPANMPLAAYFLESTPEPVLIKSSDGVYVFINDAFEQAFGVKRSDVIGLRASQIWGDYITENADNTDADLLANGEAMSYEIHFERKDGRSIDLLVRKFLMTDENAARLIGVTYTDITKRKNIERELAESEQRYALASHEVGIWDWNLDTGEVYVSPAFRRLLGLSPGSSSRISKEAIRELYHPDDFELHQQRLEEHLSDRTKPYESVHRFRRKDGTYRWFRAVGHATKTAGDTSERVIGMLTDIDDERRMTEELRLSEARISTLLNNSPSSIYFKDLDLRLVIANKKYLEMYGISLEDAFGKTSIELFGEEQGRPYFDHDREVLEQNKLIAREETLNERDLLTIKFPIIDRDGGLAGVGGIETDITENKEVERAYKNARDDAEAANRAKSAFLANMSHELRTPLNSVIGFSESLLTGTLGELEDENHREYITIINSAGSYLLDLINDILDLSRIESGHVTLDEDTFDIHSTITSAITFCQARHANKVIEIHNLTTKNLPKIRADKRQLRQVLINLLTNSLKFTSSGGNIQISCQLTDSGGLEISVTDNGIGMSALDLERVLHPFVQVADSMTRQHEGTGLGLAIVQSIAELHKADFSLESQVDVGTTARFTLPSSRVVN